MFSGRNCTNAYNNKIDKVKLNSTSDINDFLSFGKNPPCFQIMSYKEYLNLNDSTSDDKFEICFPSGPIDSNNDKTMTLIKLVEEMTEHIKYSDYYIHLVFIKRISKRKPIIISHLLAEIVDDECTIHYICKCDKINKSCDLKKIGLLMIYYTAFVAKKNNGCTILKLISDRTGGDKLKKYYESLGFIDENSLLNNSKRPVLKRVWSKRETINNMEINSDGSKMVMSLLSFNGFVF